MAYGISNGHVIDDVTWPPKLLWGSTVGYPSDSLASCQNSSNAKHFLEVKQFSNGFFRLSGSSVTDVAFTTPTRTFTLIFYLWCRPFSPWTVMSLSVHAKYYTANFLFVTFTAVTETRYDTTEKFNVDYKAESGRFNLAYVTRNKKEETKTNTCHCPLRPVEVQDPWRQSRRNQENYGGKVLWNRCIADDACKL